MYASDYYACMLLSLRSDGTYVGLRIVGDLSYEVM